DGRWVVTASDDATARIWDSQTSQPVGEPMRHQDSVRGAEFSPDGMLVLTASFDGTARLWDARTGRPVAEPFQHGDKAVSAHFSPDGRCVLTAAVSNGARLWDVPPMILGEDLGSRGFAGMLLADLAEGVIGKQVSAQGTLESVPSSRLAEVRQRIGW